MGDWYKLKNGLKWSGRLRICGDVGADEVPVEFDAKSSSGDYIYDRTVLTAEQFTDWTGKPPPAVRV